MMMQFNPPIPVRVPPDIDALARFVIDRGPGTHLEWVCQIVDGSHAGEVWTFENPCVRVNTSITEGWMRVSPFSAEEIERFKFLDAE